jgi:predicted aldo/keto reductase-like oxidoreductase
VEPVRLGKTDLMGSRVGMGGNRLNFVSDEPAEELVSPAREQDVGFIAMKPLAGGQLKGARPVIKYLLQFDNVVPAPGIQRAEEIEEIVNVASRPWDLTSRERQEMEATRAQLGQRFRQWCYYCMPCPQEMDIPMPMNIRNGGNCGLDLPSAMAAAESAKNCIQCGECEGKCPFHLPIRGMIVENLAFHERVAAEYGRRGRS